MRVEAVGPSITAITAITAVRPAVAPAIGAAGLGRIEPAPFSTIVNEGPVGVAVLNHVTRPFGRGDFSFGLGSRVERISNPFKVENVKVSVQSSLNVAARIPRAFALPNRMFRVDYIEKPMVSPQPVGKSGLVPEIQFQPQTRVVTEIPHPQVMPQAEVVEKTVEEVVEKPREKENLKEDEEVSELKRVYLEDEEVSEVRRNAVKGAIKAAIAEAIKSGLGKITGILVARFLPTEYEGNRSQIVKKRGPDGSYERILEEVWYSGDFYTEEQAQQVLDKILQTNRPVKLGKNNEDGQRVTIEEVSKVLKTKRVNPAVLEFVTRVIKKRQIRQRVVEYQSNRVEEQTIYGN